MNDSIYVSQIEGVFVQGVEWLKCYELCFSQEGKLLSIGPLTYKLLEIREISKVFIIKLLENAENEEKTIFRSKAVGKPSLLLITSNFLALKESIKVSLDVLTISYLTLLEHQLKL